MAGRGFYIQMVNTQLRKLWTLQIQNLGKFFPFPNQLLSHPWVSPTEFEEYDGNVRILTVWNFKKLALESDKDVLVKFYAPWCTHWYKNIFLLMFFL